MRKFADNAGREWHVDLNVTTLKRVRDVCKIDLANTDPKSPDFTPTRLDDPATLVDVLFVLCRDQAAKLGLTDEQFGTSMGGKVIGDAADALMECIADFSHGPKQAVLRALMKNNQRVAGILETRALKILDDPATAEKIALSLIGSSTPTNSPASSASTPVPSPSAN